MRDVRFFYVIFEVIQQPAKKNMYNRNWDHGLLRERYMAFIIQWYFVVSKWDHTEIPKPAHET